MKRITTHGTFEDYPIFNIGLAILENSLMEVKAKPLCPVCRDRHYFFMFIHKGCEVEVEDETPDVEGKKKKKKKKKEKKPFWMLEKYRCDCDGARVDKMTKKLPSASCVTVAICYSCRNKPLKYSTYADIKTIKDNCVCGSCKADFDKIDLEKIMLERAKKILNETDFEKLKFRIGEIKDKVEGRIKMTTDEKTEKLKELLKKRYRDGLS